MKKFIFVLTFCAIGFILFSCNQKKQGEVNNSTSDSQMENPAAEGFDAAGSDQKAIEIADKVMVAMGGRKNWDKERFFKWNFFNARMLWWDKQTGDVRIEMKNEDSTIILVNIMNEQGRLFNKGIEETQPDSVEKYMKRGKGIWINDAYWLFMPFKLKDSGVTLTYVGEDTTQAGVRSDVLQLTFKNEGNTPQNKYHVWVDQSDNLIKQWAYFSENTMEAPNFITPWNDYKQYGSLLLGGDRGERDISDIEVTNNMDESIFRGL